GAGGVQPLDDGGPDQRDVPERQPALPGGGEPGPGVGTVRQPAAPADRVDYYRRLFRVPGPTVAAGDDPGVAEPARATEVHPAGVAPGGVRGRLLGWLPVRAGERSHAGQTLPAVRPG